MPSVGTISGKLVLNISEWDKGIKQSLATTKVFQRDINAVFKATRSNVDVFVGSMRTLKAAFVQGKIGAQQYTSGMRLLREQLAATLPGMQAQIPAINAYRANIKTLATAMQAGVITMKQYRGALLNLKTAYVAANPAPLTRAMRAQAIAGKALVATGAAIRTSLLLYVGPLAAIFAVFKTFKVQEDIERAMRGSLAIMKDVTGAMRREMRQTAIDVARNTIASTEEAAKAYFFLASAGLDAAQSLKALPAVAEFAQAGMFDLSRATDLLTDAQMALGLSSKNAEKNLQGMVRVSDVLVRANTIANATVEQFSEALTNKAAAAARRYGQSLEQVVAMLTVYASQGVKGMDAGSQFDIVMKNLTIKALENADAFRRLNVDVYDPLTGKVRFLGDIMADLEKTMEGMTAREQVLTLMTLGFTKKTISATAALIGFSDAAKAALVELERADGATSDVAGKQLTEFQVGWNALAASINDSSSNLQKFNDLLGKAMQFLAMPKPKLKVDFGFVDDEAKAFKRLVKERKESAGFLAISLKKREFEGASRPEDKRIAKRFDELKKIAKLEREREQAAGAGAKQEMLLDNDAIKNNKLEVAEIAKAYEDAQKAAESFLAKLEFDKATLGLTELEKQARRITDELQEGAAAIDEINAAVIEKGFSDAMQAVRDFRGALRFDKETGDKTPLGKQLDKLGKQLAKLLVDVPNATQVWDEFSEAIADVIEADKRLDLAKKAKEAAKELKKTEDAAKRFGETLSGQFATSEEKFAKLIKDLLQWRDIMGKLPGFDSGLFDKAVKGAKGEFLKGITQRDPSDFLVDTLSKGSAEAFREEIGGRQKDEELELAREQVDLLERQILAEQQGANRIVRAINDQPALEAVQ